MVDQLDLRLATDVVYGVHEVKYIGRRSRGAHRKIVGCWKEVEACAGGVGPGGTVRLAHPARSVQRNIRHMMQPTFPIRPPYQNGKKPRATGVSRTRKAPMIAGVVCALASRRVLGFVPHCRRT